MSSPDDELDEDEPVVLGHFVEYPGIGAGLALQIDGDPDSWLFSTCYLKNVEKAI